MDKPGAPTIHTQPTRYVTCIESFREASKQQSIQGTPSPPSPQQFQKAMNGVTDRVPSACVLVCE